jgi:hypothetical protein
MSIARHWIPVLPVGPMSLPIVHSASLAALKNATSCGGWASLAREYNAGFFTVRKLTGVRPFSRFSRKPALFET